MTAREGFEALKAAELRLPTLLAIAVFIAASGSILLTRDHTEIAAVWLPNAIVLATIIRHPRARWPLLLGVSWLANATANLITGNPWHIAVFCSVGNIVEILVCALVLTAGHTPRFDLVQLDDFLRLVVGALGGAVLSGAIATGVMAPGGDVPPSTLFVSWFLSDWLGLLIFTPSIAILLSVAPTDLLPRRPGAIVSWGAFLGGTALVFGQSVVDLLPAAPLLLIPIVLGLEAASAALALTVLSLAAILATAYGFGPLASAYAETTPRLQYLQVILALIALLGTPAAMALAQRRHLMRSLDERDREWQALATSMRDVIVRYGPDTTILYLSPSCEAVLGHRPEDLVGSRIEALLHPDDVAEGRRALADIARAGPEGPMQNVRLRARHKDGHWVWFEGRPRALFDASTGRAAMFFDVMRDVSRQVADEADLKAAREAAEQASRAKSEFVATMSHELRTPLNSVIGYSRLLTKSGALDDRDRRYAHLVENAAEATVSIINDILDGAAIERGALALRYAPVSLRVVIDGVASLVAPMADEKGVVVAVRMDERIAPTLDGDVDRLRQIMLNLASNAVKFTDTGEVEIGATLVEDASDRQRLRLWVRDTGIGIAPEHHALVFERFTQVAADRGDGSGLGLSITHQLVALMGGMISLESAPGRGSTFSIDLTLAKRNADAERATPKQSLSPLRILVVDDVDLNRELVCAILAPHGHVMETAGSGAEAVARCRDGRFDAILMDVRMPGMDGLEATRAIRAGGASAHAVIIALTAGMHPGKRAACIAAGMDACLGKPVDERSLLEALAFASVVAAGPPPAPAVEEDLRRRFRDRLAQERMTLATSARDSAFAEIVHRMAGSAGSFGFGAVGEMAAVLDTILDNGGAGAEEALGALLEAIDLALSEKAA